MKITLNKENRTYSIERDDGTVVELTINEVNLLVVTFNKDSLRDAVVYVLDRMVEEGEINIDAYEDGADSFVDEICECFNDEVEMTGQLPDDEEIETKIGDEARWHDGMLPEEE